MINPLNNKYSKTLGIIGVGAGAFMGWKEGQSKIIPYALLWGGFGLLMGAVAKNVVPMIKITKKLT